MMNNNVIHTYNNMYLNNTKNNLNAVDKSFCVVMKGMITYTIYTKLQKCNYHPDCSRADNDADTGSSPNSS
jgi:hypothetical protein